MKPIFFVNIIKVNIALLLLGGCQTINTPFLVTVDKRNLLYVNLPNPVYVWVPGPKKNLILETENGTVEVFEDKYFITPSRLGKGTVRIKSKKKELGEWYFNAIAPDKPIAKFLIKGHLWDRPSTISDIQGLMIFYEIDYDVKISILSFDFVLKRNNEIIQTVFNTGGVFVDEAREIMRSNLKAGDIILFENIVAQYPNGNKVLLDARTITVPDKF